MINVLITSVGGGVGQSVLDSISHLVGSYKIVGLDLSDKVLARNQCDEFLISPRISDPRYVEFLLETCANYKIDILIPGNDGELELLSRCKEKFSQNGTKVVVSPTKIVKSSRNKYNWYVDYSHILNIVPTALYDEFKVKPELFSNIEFPVIAKPAAGSASSGIKIFLSLDELLNESLPEDESKNYVIQPYLMPPEGAADYQSLWRAVKQRRLLQQSEISCQIVYSDSSEVLGIFVSRNSLKNGVPVTIEPITESTILKEIEEIAERLKDEKVIGPVNIQGRLTEMGLVFFEMNLRFTGITGNRSQFGFNEVSKVINEFQGIEDETELASNTCRVGGRQVACTTSYPLSERCVKTMMVTGASSWAAQNFIRHFAATYDSNEMRLVLSCRNPSKLKSELSGIIGAGRKLANVQVIGVSEVELSKAIGVSDVFINYASARPPHGAEKIHEATVFNLSLVDLLKFGNPGLVINMSSQSVYDAGVSTVHSEGSRTAASTPYSASKLLLEHAFNSIKSFTRGTQVVSLRLGRLWGGELEPDQTQFPFRLLDSMVGTGKFQVANTQNEISMLDVDDLSDSVFGLIEMWIAGKELPSVLNLGGANTNIEQLVSALEKVLVEQQVVYLPVAIMEQIGNADSFVIDSKRAKDCGVLSISNLSDSWKKLVNSYSRHLNYRGMEDGSE